MDCSARSCVGFWIKCPWLNRLNKTIFHSCQGEKMPLRWRKVPGRVGKCTAERFSKGHSRGRSETLQCAVRAGLAAGQRFPGGRCLVLLQSDQSDQLWLREHHDHGDQGIRQGSHHHQDRNSRQDSPAGLQGRLCGQGTDALVRRYSLSGNVGVGFPQFSIRSYAESARRVQKQQEIFKDLRASS